MSKTAQFIRQKNFKYYCSVLCIALITRFFYLGSIPPGGVHALWLRFPSALAGVLSIGLLMFLVHKWTRKPQLAFLSGLALTLMPWHIEQSRVYSPAMLGLMVILAWIVLQTSIKNKALKALSLVFAIGIFYFVYPSFWLFSFSGQVPTLYNFILNLFKLVSGEFLFFKNDSFWSGGLRTVGVFLPSTSGIFLIGLYELLRRIRLQHLRIFVPFVIVWFLTAANPQFPEAREYFLSAPYFAFIVALGGRKMYQLITHGQPVYKLTLLALCCFMLYEYTLFFHQYTYHYAQRIANEISYEARNF